MKIVEIGGIGPGPFCAQMLADSAKPNESTLREWNISEKEIKALKTDGAI